MTYKLYIYIYKYWFFLLTLDLCLYLILWACRLGAFPGTGKPSFVSWMKYFCILLQTFNTKRSYLFFLLFFLYSIHFFTWKVHLFHGILFRDGHNQSLRQPQTLLSWKIPNKNIRLWKGLAAEGAQTKSRLSLAQVNKVSSCEYTGEDYSFNSKRNSYIIYSSLTTWCKELHQLSTWWVTLKKQYEELIAQRYPWRFVDIAHRLLG